MVGHLEISALASRHQLRHCRQHRHWHYKNFILPFEVFIFALRSFLWTKTSMVKSFSIILVALTGKFGCCLEQFSYSIKNLLVPAFEEKNSTVDLISGVLKKWKVESCSLQVCKFLIRSFIRDPFLKIFCKFQSTFEKYGWEFVLQTVYC